MSESRTKNVIRNLRYSVLLRMSGLLTGFLLKTLFVYELGREYVGINGVFSDVISVLTLTELGIGAAIVYDMYAPLAQKDKYKITQLFQLYSHVYMGIGLIVFLLGLLLLPFLDVIITDVPNVDHLEIIYILTIINTASSYFYAQYASILGADQKDSIVSKYNLITTIARTVVESVLLIYFHSYVFYLIADILSKWICNYSLANKAGGVYPFLHDKVESMPWRRVREIVSNAINVFSIKFASVVQCSTDSLLISAMLSTVLAGSYSLYVMVIAAVQGVIYMIKTTALPSIGNLCASNQNYELRKQVFARMQFIVAWCNVVCVSCLAVLLTPFIELWAGESYVLPNLAVALMIFNYLMRGIQWPVEAFYNADGLYRHFGKKPWVEAALNILFSILLCRCLGIAGIIMGTTLAQMCATLWYDIYITNKYTLHGSLKEYWYLTLQYSLITGLIALMCIWICMNIATPWSWLTWCGKAIMCILISVSLFGIIYRRNEHLKYFFRLIKF